jgi:hypothetical protein
MTLKCRFIPEESAEVVNTWNYTPLPNTSSRRGTLAQGLYLTLKYKVCIASAFGCEPLKLYIEIQTQKPKDKNVG